MASDHHVRILPVIRRLAATGMTWAQMARDINEGSVLGYGEGPFWEVSGQYLYSVAVRAGLRKPRAVKCKHCPVHCGPETVVPEQETAPKLAKPPKAAPFPGKCPDPSCTSGTLTVKTDGCKLPYHVDGQGDCYVCHDCEENERPIA